MSVTAPELAIWWVAGGMGVLMLRVGDLPEFACRCYMQLLSYSGRGDHHDLIEHAGPVRIRSSSSSRRRCPDEDIPGDQDRY